MPTPENTVGFFFLLKYAFAPYLFGTSVDYESFGEGIGALYDGYSLFTPPHGASSWSFSGWVENFFTNPYCADCPSFADIFFGGVNTWIYFSAFAFLILIAFFKMRLKELEKKEEILYDTVFDKDVQGSNEYKNKKWQEIMSLLNSPNQNDWKQAIINADNLLERVLLEQGFEGESLGEKLKNADFETLPNAWSAHKIRNRIAHEADFVLTQRQAKGTIQNYSKVFSEFYY